jgi:hypothetical protein
MGYVEETGAAQHLRDARITTIYEGTTAIQANDFMGRKILRDGGVEIRKLMDEMRQTVVSLHETDSDSARRLGDALERGIAALADAVDWVLGHGKTDAAAAFMGSVPLVQLAGFVCGGWMMGRSALIAVPKKDGEPIYNAKIAAAGFYASHVLLPNLGLLSAVKAGKAALAEAEGFTSH